MGRVTRSHFSRLLSILNLQIGNDDLHILFRKYEDRSNGTVNYMEFIRTIDPESNILPIIYAHILIYSIFQLFERFSKQSS